MAVRRIKNHGKWVWRARVAHRGRHRAAFVRTREQARDEEARLRADLKAEAEQEEQATAAPATLRQLLEFYQLDMQARGRGDESAARADYTRRSIEAVTPELLDKPVSRIARSLLLRQREASTGVLVFPGPGGRPWSREQIGKTFRKAARAAGLEDFHFHDLRHHGATMALNRGFTAPIVMALGGWKTERMMRHYAAVTDQTLRAAAEAVSGAPTSGLVQRAGAAER